MSWLLFILAFLMTIIVVVGIHEAAHFLTAKLIGVKVLRFSIGFGKTLLSWHDKSGTEYVFALIPLGGYVKMLGEADDTVNENEKMQSYSVQPFYKKACIILAGPLANFICALLLYIIIYSIGFTTIKPILGNIAPNSIAAKANLLPYTEIMEVNGVATPSWTKVLFQLIVHAGEEQPITLKTKQVCGLTETPLAHCESPISTPKLNLSTFKLTGVRPDPFKSLGIEPYFPTIPLTIGHIADNALAAKAGLMVNDRLIKLNQQPIKSWEQLAEDINKQRDKPLVFEIKRNNKTLSISLLLPASSGWFKSKPRLGIAPPQIKIPDAMLQNVQYSPIQAIYHAYLQCKEITYFNLIVLGKMLTGKLSLDSLGGPIAIFDTAGQALNQGTIMFMVFLAFMNLSIGLINLLPIPGLDGGQLLLQAIESLIKRKIPVTITEWILFFGFALLFLIFMRALYNDLLRLL